MYKVISPFYDKENNYIRYNEGDTYESNDSKRVAFLIEQGFLKESKPKGRKAKDGE